jgi:hypothetical protein
VDSLLAQGSWDQTWQRMNALIEAELPAGTSGY